MGTATAPGRATEHAAAGRPASAIRFSKMQGAGNDFVVLDLRQDATLAERLSNPGDGLCRALANRRTGVGCDQVLGIERARSDGAVAAYRIWNADGSPARQCGNGARCVAAWLVRDGAAGEDFRLDSPSGTHAVQRAGKGRYTIGMGAPSFAPESIPLAGADREQDVYVVDLDGTEVAFGAVSMGNPHAVVVVEDVDDAPVATLGPALQRSASFPESVNVGFVQVLARDRIRLRVCERGAGETLACGSGACAAVAVLTRQGRVDGQGGVAVSLPGGDLHIQYDPGSGAIGMTGPAAFVFEGEMAMEDGA
ncbi:diaminopimelate epimerase [Luteimonas vadosa]|uniref:Diaminopimelate epimerase n=1 Tax=Luteimonas vadosa TaxID=1165507 RepID=A0ABP9DQE2_9GAMM